MPSRPLAVERSDIAIIGAGVLGVTIAYWLSRLHECSVVVIDSAKDVAVHTSSRNTGVIHRPFYLNPKTRRIFAASANLSYPMWKSLAARLGLPWNQVGTIEVALGESQVETLNKYSSWGLENGMEPDEFEVLSGSQVKSIEPEVKCLGAIHSRTDTSVDFGAFTRAVFQVAKANGVRFVGCTEVRGVAAGDDEVSLLCRRSGASTEIRCRFLINAAGGGAVDVARFAGVGSELTDLHFRGDYWIVGDPFAHKVSRNVYSVAKHAQFPFLDPHFVIRADGTRQIGPNAALVDGPFTYSGVGKGIIGKILERPVQPKARLFRDSEFLSLVWAEWRSSISKKSMCDRVRKFLPELRADSLVRRGISGVRSSVVDRNGFVPEAIQLWGKNSFHIINYNSPGATGAPVYSAFVVKRLRESGVFPFPERRPVGDSIWSFEDVSSHLDVL